MFLKSDVLRYTRKRYESAGQLFNTNAYRPETILET